MKLSRLLRQYRGGFIFTVLLVLLDAVLLVLFPLLIGQAISDVLNESYRGAIQLGLLGMATLMVGAGRRFFDSRFYAKIYEILGTQIGDREDQPVTTRNAHLGFLTEVVEFFENLLPELINSTIGLIGTLVILAALNTTVFLGCLVVLLITVIIYGLSAKRTRQLNEGYNEEMEQRVSVLSEPQPLLLRHHLKKLMRWNIRLSDLETVNFATNWLFMMAFLVLSIVFVVKQGSADFGMVFSLVLYLFQFIGIAGSMPLFYQQWLRLKSIIGRLESI